VDYKPGIIDDRKLIAEVWKVLDEADIVIAHNGDAFDIKKIFARFAYYGLKPPSPFKTIDTLKAARRRFKFDRNNLDELGKYFQVGRKKETTGLKLWLNCMKGDMQAWARMKRYNVGDVTLLKRVYLRLRPYIDNHPSLNLIDRIKNEQRCPSCKGTRIQRQGWRMSAHGRYPRLQCQDCGSWCAGSYERLKAA